MPEPSPADLATTRTLGWIEIFDTQATALRDVLMSSNTSTDPKALDCKVAWCLSQFYNIAVPYMVAHVELHNKACDKVQQAQEIKEQD